MRRDRVLGRRRRQGSHWLGLGDRRPGVAFMGNYAPAILTASPPSVGGPEYFGIAAGFLTDIRWTWYVSLYGAYHESTSGWTASTDELGQPIAGSVGYGWWPPSGGFGVSGVRTRRARRAADSSGGRRDRTTRAPVIPRGSPARGSERLVRLGRLGSVGVADESPVRRRTAVTRRRSRRTRPGTTLTCSASSAGGTGRASTMVQRDTTPPTDCPSPTPTSSTRSAPG